VGRLIAVLAAAALAVAGVAWALPEEDDVRVDRTTPEAMRAIAVAREVVAGSLVEVARDSDNGKWEVTLRQDGRDYEVELEPGTFELLRVDYD
jgi:hypothetical protein